MIKQVMLYGSTVWSNCSSDNNESLQASKHAARVNLEAKTRSKSMKLFKKLEWLPFYEEVELNKSVLVFKCLQGNCCAYMCYIIKFNADLHTQTVRYSKLNLVLLFQSRNQGREDL